MSVHCFKPIRISELSDAKFERLVEQLGHLGLNVTPLEQGYSVSGQDIAGNLSYDSPTGTLTVEIHELPTIVTPGHFVGRLYDEILSLNES
jgi:hypothetical protein